MLHSSNAAISWNMLQNCFYCLCVFCSNIHVSYLVNLLMCSVCNYYDYITNKPWPANFFFLFRWKQASVYYLILQLLFIFLWLHWASSLFSSAARRKKLSSERKCYWGLLKALPKGQELCQLPRQPWSSSQMLHIVFFFGASQQVTIAGCL